MDDSRIAIFELFPDEDDIVLVVDEKHYQLVSASTIGDSDRALREK
jgi:hypothetical protein